jgi:hypothetical protein
MTEANMAHSDEILTGEMEYTEDDEREDYLDYCAALRP